MILPLDTTPADTLERYFRAGLKLSHLRVLVSLARLGQVGKVARAYHVTQPAISKQLAEIERHLGLAVVQRQGRNVTLTPAGLAMAEAGRQVLQVLDSTRRELDALGAGLAGTLRLGAVASVMPTLVPAGLARFRARAPNARLILQENTTDLLFPRLRDGELDVVLARTSLPAPEPALVEHPVGEDPIVVVCGRAHPLARQHQLEWSDLSPYPWILPPPGSAIHADLSEVFTRHGLAPGPGSIVSTSMTATPLLLEDARLLALLPRAFAQPLVERAQVATLPLTFPLASAAVRMLWQRDAETPLLRVLIESFEAVGARLRVGL